MMEMRLKIFLGNPGLLLKTIHVVLNIGQTLCVDNLISAEPAFWKS